VGHIKGDLPIKKRGYGFCRWDEEQIRNDRENKTDERRNVRQARDQGA